MAISIIEGRNLVSASDRFKRESVPAINASFFHAILQKRFKSLFLDRLLQKLTEQLNKCIAMVRVCPLINIMVNSDFQMLDGILQALANKTRRAILLSLTESPSTVGELARPFKMSAPAISRHLRILERSGLIVRSRDGQLQRIRLERGQLEPLRGFMAELETGSDSIGVADDEPWGTDEEEFTKLL